MQSYTLEMVAFTCLAVTTGLPRFDATMRSSAWAWPRASAAVLLVAMAISVAACREASTVPPPNILLITVDTLRADHTSFLDHERDTTPNLRRYFANGRIFERAYASEANTSPSIVSILSGLYPQHHRVRLLYQKVDPELVLLPDLLKVAGYRTAGIVSNIVLTDEALGLGSRFDHFDDFVDEREKGWNVFERVAARTTDSALRWLVNVPKGDQPIFLWVHYIDPHGPYRPPPDAPVDFTHSQPLPIELDRVHSGHRPYGLTDGLEYVDRYDEEIAYTDREIGRLLAGFERLGLAEGAVTLFTADHGETMMEFSLWFAHGFHVVEPIIHVPLAIRAPGVRPGREKTAVSLVGILPTVLELAGLPIPDGLDAKSFAGVAAGQTVFAEATSGRHRQWRTAIKGDQKWLVDVREGRDTTQRWQYSIDQERGALGRWDERHPVGKDLLAKIASDPDPAGVPASLRQGIQIDAPKVAPGLDAKTIERLRALGYVE